MDKERSYGQSHPWISFRLDVHRASPRLWVLLGQAVAYCRQMGHVVLPPSVAASLHKLYLIRGVRGTTTIEGNTLSEEQIGAQIDGRLDLPSSQAYLRREVDNILRACRDIWPVILHDDATHGRTPRLSAELIRACNRRVLEGLEDHLEEGIVAGEIPTHAVVVGGYRGAPREDCAYLLDRLCQWLEGGADLSFFREVDDNRIATGILHAVLVHLYVAWIHPFGDGNGRTARLLEFMVLVRAGVPSPAAHLLSNHYALTRTRYYRELDRSSRADSGRGDALGFILYALQGLVDGLEEQHERISGMQLIIAWRDFVSEQFRSERMSPALDRRRHLLLALGHQSEPVAKRKLADMSPGLARLYAGRTVRTLSRDLNWLAGKDLVEQPGRGFWRAKVERMWAFRFPRA